MKAFDHGISDASQPTSHDRLAGVPILLDERELETVAAAGGIAGGVVLIHRR